MELTHRSNSSSFALRSGKGKWKEIATMIPTRSTIQVKTHAQQVMKRVQAGDDVFAEFQELWEPSSGQQAASHGFSVSSSGFSAVPCSPKSNESTDSVNLYDSLSQDDQGAVQILYQMAQLTAVRVL